ncbi:MAG: hypothetical protein HY083_01535 [Gammaproteobacteria bacterium]|nr:hypothetical protein [Gammaproteobacteria bacterium]
MIEVGFAKYLLAIPRLFASAAKLFKQVAARPHLVLHWVRRLKFWGVSWDFSGYFLGMSALGGRDIHVSSLQILGTNHSKTEIKVVGGYIESNITHEKIPLLLESMPPEETNGIPAKCTFWIRALFRDPTAAREGIALDKFLGTFGDFAFVFMGDGWEYRYRFGEREVHNMVRVFEKESNPPSKPIVTRRAI